MTFAARGFRRWLVAFVLVAGVLGPATVAQAAPATHFTVTVSPSSVTAGVAATITVTALDVNGNTAVGYAGTVHFTSTDAAASLPSDYTFVAGDGGVHSFPGGVTFKTAGNQTVSATDTTTPSITGTSPTVTVQPATANRFAVAAPATATTGTAFALTVTAFDRFGNVASGYAGSVHFTSTDPAAALPADAKLASGVGNFTATLNTAGNRTITATDATAASITGTSATITAQTPTVPSRPGPPTVSIVSPTAGAVFRAGTVITASYACADSANGPGIASCVGSVANGGALDKTVGTHTLSVTATSKDGQLAQAHVTYSVVAPSNRLTLSGVKVRHHGVVTFTVAVPGPGTISTVETSPRSANAPRSRRRSSPPVVASRRLVAKSATKMTVTVMLNRSGRRLLARDRHGLTVQLVVTFTPTGGSPRTIVHPGLLLRNR
jgi:hypothetical protein